MACTAGRIDPSDAEAKGSANKLLFQVAFGFLIWIFASSWVTWVFWRRNATRKPLRRLKTKERPFEAFSYSVSTTLQDLK
jgi:hypothetical protein